MILSDLTASKCGGYEFNGHTYHFPTVKKSRTDAESHCNMLGEGLAIMDTREDMIFVQSVLHQVNPDQNEDFYIGKAV